MYICSLVAYTEACIFHNFTVYVLVYCEVCLRVLTVFIKIMTLTLFEFCHKTLISFVNNNKSALRQRLAH